MDSDRVYPLTNRITRSMSRSTALQQALQHGVYREPTVLPLQERDIPSRQDLDQMRQDLESILNYPEERKERLERDLEKIENIQAARQKRPRRSSANSRGGKDIKVIERDEYDGPASSRSHGNRISKSQLERQAALETLKRRRRREDSDRDEPNGSYSGTSDYAQRQNGVTVVAAGEEEEGSLNSSDTLQRKRKADEKSPTSNPKKRATGNGQHENRDEELDFVRVKPQNQVPIYTYWSALEPYFRALTEDDREFLMQKDDDVIPFEIPPLGRYYKDKWEEEEALLLGDDNDYLTTATTTTTRTTTAAGSSSKRSYSQMNGDDDEDNEDSEGGKEQRSSSDGMILQRWLSSLVPEPAKSEEEALELKAELDDGEYTSEGENVTDQDGDDESIITHVEISRNAVEISSDVDEEQEDFEERLKEELCYVGVLNEDQLEGDWPAHEDDEISAELRRLQRELKEQVEVNENRKRKLLKVVDQQLQYEQYQQVLDTFDQQVEQSYVKRFRAQKVKKRKSASASKPPLSEHVIAAMQKRTTWVQEFGPIFKEKNMVMPRESIYGPES